MTRPLALTAVVLALAAGAAQSAVVDCTFEGEHLVFTYDPEEGDANSEATVKEGDRVSSVLVQMGPGIVSFLDIPSDGRIMITSLQAANGKAVHSSHGAADGALSASQVQGQCEQTP